MKLDEYQRQVVQSAEYKTGKGGVATWLAARLRSLVLDANKAGYTLEELARIDMEEKN